MPLTIQQMVEQVVSGLLLNAFYSAQILQASQGKPLNDQELKVLLAETFRDWHEIKSLLQTPAFWEVLKTPPSDQG